MVMKLSMMVVLFESLCDSCFDGKCIFKVLTSFIEPSSSEINDLWHMALEIKHFVEFDTIRLESLYYKGESWAVG